MSNVAPEYAVEPTVPAVVPSWASRLVGGVAVVGLFAWLITSRCSLGTFVEAGILLASVTGPLALLMLAFGWGTVRTACLALVRTNVPPVQLRRAVAVWRLAAVLALAWGVVVMLVGLMIMLRNMDDPHALGPALAMCMLSVLYGVVLAILALAAAVALAQRLAGRDDRDLDALSRQSLTAVAAGAAGTIVPTILLALTAALLPLV